MLRDTLGQSALLVPYFSWQRSHAVHHANTNHMELGETHVPEMVEHTGFGFGLQDQRKLFRSVLGKKLGTVAFGMLSTVNHLVVSQRWFLARGGRGGGRPSLS